MILILPYLKMRKGECSFCIEGEQGTAKMYDEYSHNPLKLLQLWRRENSKTIHIADLDAIENESNIENANSIIFLANSIDIPVQLYSPFRDVAECGMYLDSGIYRIVIGDLLQQDPDGIAELIKTYTPSRVAFGGVVQGANFISSSEYTFEKYCESVANVGGNRVVVSDKSWQNSKPDIMKYRYLFEKYHLRFTLIEACSNYQELEFLNKNAKPGIDSVIMGDSLYKNNFPCQKIWRIAEALIEPEVYCK